MQQVGLDEASQEALFVVFFHKSAGGTSSLFTCQVLLKWATEGLFNCLHIRFVDLVHLPLKPMNKHI